jgi:hypothetical protein
VPPQPGDDDITIVTGGQRLEGIRRRDRSETLSDIARSYNATTSAQRRFRGLTA